jgi:uncharacterized protein (DUF433 family)
MHDAPPIDAECIAQPPSRDAVAKFGIKGMIGRSTGVNAMQQLDRITFDRQIMNGQACIRGMRIPASLIINLVAHGKSTAEILEEYPDLEPEDIRQALAYASWLAREQVYTGKSA